VPVRSGAAVCSTSTAPGSTTARTASAWTVSPARTRTSATRPSTPASTPYSIFIDSMTTTAVDAVTGVPGSTTRTTVPVSGERTSTMTEV
jgi:hypothetical protein